MRTPIPLSRRPVDFVIIGFFAVNLFFITYIVDLEQIVIADPYHFTPPLWPLPSMVAMDHWWQMTFDPLVLARPAWYRATIWIDALGFGPFYAVAIYAYVRGRDWIRIPSIIWASVMFTNVVIILFDELLGIHASPRPFIVVSANASWLLMPFLVIWRVARSEHPFTEPATTPAVGQAA
jgi:hypothetical protein